MTSSEYLQKALDLGVVTPDQLQHLMSQSQDNNIEEALENLISTQMSSGSMCTGDSCTF